MDRMTALRREARRLAYASLCVALCLALGCDRSDPMHPEDAAAPASSKALPFHPDREQAASSESAGPAIPGNAKPAVPVPFSATQARVVPAGTLLTVQLLGSLSTAKVRAGDIFTASLAAPLTIDGETLIQSGTAVTGRVESEQAHAGLPGLIPGSGYFQLTLSTISIDGKPIELQTSSLFARGTIQPSIISSSRGPSDPQTENVRVRKGHPLTFRLTAPVTLGYTNATAKDQYPARNVN